MACFVYSEQVGVKLQITPNHRRPPPERWYALIIRNARAFMRGPV